jgi:hypothetical protein
MSLPKIYDWLLIGGGACWSYRELAKAAVARAEGSRSRANQALGNKRFGRMRRMN